MHNLRSSLAVLTAAILLPAAAQAQTKITIGIPTSPPNIVHMPAIVAKDLGLYKKAGLDVDIVSLGDGTKVYRALLAGNIEFGLTPGAPTIIGRSNGAAQLDSFSRTGFIETTCRRNLSSDSSIPAATPISCDRWKIGIWKLLPAWYHIVFLLLLVPATLLGARLRGTRSIT